MIVRLIIIIKTSSLGVDASGSARRFDRWRCGLFRRRYPGNLTIYSPPRPGRVGKARVGAR
eukprot:3952093-Prymnesium_polylepis.1